jgi:hypothetical protein
MSGATSGAVMAASPRRGAGAARRLAGGRPACSSDVGFAGNFPVCVSEGDLNTEIGEIAPMYDDQPRIVVQLSESD